MKKFIYTSYLLLLSEIAFGQATAAYEGYIAKYSEVAVEKMNKYGIPASITLAQGILESGAGTSRLAVEANNHFGIKCHDWTGERIYHDDDESQECFRKYTDARQSFDDHSLFLTSRPRYAFLFDYGKTDYRSWANGLKKAGYATDPNYPARLIKIIEDYQLYKYDTSATSKSKETYLTEKKQENVPPNSAEQTRPAQKPSSKVVYTSQKKPATTAKSTPQTAKKVYVSDKIIGQVTAYSEHVVKQINGVKYVLALENDSYQSIADEYSLKLNEIYAINDAERGAELRPGEIVYIRAKKSTASRSFHVVQPGESMRDIAQMYGIKLNVLYKKNNMREGANPLIGQRLILK